MMLAAALLLTAVTAQPAPEAVTSCTTCHLDADLFEESEVAAVAPMLEDVHAQAGLSCHDCHGGNPDPAVADDMEAAMDEGFAPHPFRAAPDKVGVPAFCGSCHSSLDVMRRFKPGARVDQESEYWTSRHGQKLRQGDEAVAACTDCHGAHGVTAVNDPQSPVYATHVADTCARCHADADLMAHRTTPDGRPLPVNQFEAWSESVHARALLDRGDLSAPTCNDCHGNHGAAPPGVDSVGFVCGQCHGREATLFRESPKSAGFEAHNELLDGAVCSDCHEEPQASLENFHAFTECASCHGNHAIVRASVAMLGDLPETPCALCHEAASESGVELGAEEPRMVTQRYTAKRDEMLHQAEEQGIAPPELFDWLVERAPQFEEHRRQVDVDGKLDETSEFWRLWRRFRIGPTTIDLVDSRTGAHTALAVRRCTSCHSTDTGEEEIAVATELRSRLRSLLLVTARADRMRLRAQRGGVSTRTVDASLDEAVDAGVELEVLLHGFDVAPESAFETRYGEGMDAASKALTAADEAYGELEYRRRGLLVALALILLVLVGLGLKIRAIES